MNIHGSSCNWYEIRCMQIELVLVPKQHMYYILADPNLVRFGHYDLGLANFILWMKQLRKLSFC